MTVEDSSSTSSSRRVEEGIMDIPCGNPIPSDEHACSVSLPKWSDVVGYEEGNVAVTSKMVCGYPRFVFHPYVVRLMDAVVQMEEGQDVDCLLLPTYDAACRAHDFLWRAVVLQDTTTTSCTNLTNTSSFAALTSSDNALQPSPTTTHSAATTTTTTPNPIIRIKDLKIPSNVHAVIFPAETKFAIAAKAYWQHTGEIVSSRRAEAALAELGWDTLTTTPSSSPPPTTSCPSSYPCLHPALIPTATTTTTTTPIHTLLKQRIASITNTCPESCVYLFPSGMAAIYSALRSARRNRLQQQPPQQQLKPNKYYGGTSIVFGFPYLDTLKLCGRPEICPDGVEFFGHGDSSDLQKLEQMLCRRRSAQQNENNNDDAGVCALLTEFPSNPLLNCHDLSQLRNLADQYNFILIVDDTISNFSNIDLISTGIADVVCTSLTKLWNGRGDAMGGSMVINPNTPKGQWMIQDMKQNHEDDITLYPSDAMALYQNSQDFLERSNQINRTAEQLADWLHEHPDVSKVYYPKFTQPHFYHRFLNHTHGSTAPGYGGLFSILLEPHMCQRTFYDSLHVCKGPSLGTNFTLVCPYTLLAHYHELEFARAYHVSPNLLRVAVGLEDFHTLQHRFDQAFTVSRLHPKLKPVRQTHRGYCTLSSSYQGKHLLQPRNIRVAIQNLRRPKILPFLCRPHVQTAALVPCTVTFVAGFYHVKRVA